MKRNRPSVEDLSKKFSDADTGKKTREVDERILPLAKSRDKDGNAYKVVRLLPVGQNDLDRGLDKPFVKKFSYAFQGKGGWYFNTSRETIGEDDPVYIENGRDYNLNTPESLARVKNRHRTIKYYSNIYVVRDKENPENEGKVMILEYGPALFKKINLALNPKFEDDPRFDPFDLWEGANFMIKIFSEDKGMTDKKGKPVIMPNYDESGFQQREEFLGGDDEKIEKVWNECHSLLDFIKPEDIKSYAVLEKELKKALGVSEEVSNARSGFDDSDQTHESDSPFLDEPVTENTVTEPVDTNTSSPVIDDSDDDAAYFRNLAGE